MSRIEHEALAQAAQLGTLPARADFAASWVGFLGLVMPLVLLLFLL